MSPPPPPRPPVAMGRRRLFQEEQAQLAGGVIADAGVVEALVNVTWDPWVNVTCGANDGFCFSCYCVELIKTSAILREKGYCASYVSGYTMQLITGYAAQLVVVVGAAVQ